MQSGGFLDREPYLDMIARDAGPAALEDASQGGNAGSMFESEMITLTTATEMVCAGKPQEQFGLALQFMFDAAEIEKAAHPPGQK